MLAFSLIHLSLHLFLVLKLSFKSDKSLGVMYSIRSNEPILNHVKWSDPKCHFRLYLKHIPFPLTNWHTKMLAQNVQIIVWSSINRRNVHKSVNCYIVEIMQKEKLRGTEMVVFWTRKEIKINHEWITRLSCQKIM